MDKERGKRTLARLSGYSAIMMVLMLHWLGCNRAQPSYDFRKVSDDAPIQFKGAELLLPDYSESYYKTGHLCPPPNVDPIAFWKKKGNGKDAATAYLYLGIYYLKNQKEDEAETAFRKHVGLNPPGDLDARFGLGCVAYQKGEYNKALGELQKALSSWNYGAYYDLGLTYGRMGNYTEAIVAFQKAAENDRCPGVARFMLGVAFEHEKRYAEAMEAYWQAALLAERDPWVVSEYQFNFSPIIRLLIPNRAQRDSYRLKTIHDYEQKFKEDDAFRYVAIGKCYCEDSLFAEGIATFKKGVEKVPNDPDLRYVLGLTLERAGQPDSAIAVYETIVNLAPQYRRVYPTLGYLYYKKNSPHKAKQVMKAYLTLPDGKNSKAARRLTERLV
jgi:tetratricopeptide (TPR) repeat protein